MGVDRRRPRLAVVVDPRGVLTTTAPTVTTSAYHVALLCYTSTRRSHSRAAHRLRRIGLSRYGRLYRRDSPNDGKSTSVITSGWNRRSTVIPANIAQISWQDSMRPKDNGLIIVIIIKE
ncbi:hypothetical protein ALC56_06509 [Trachymyrmex septentrionalis]|uniref:Uncharacterized protein n=1 Tax=Trachymyrmex septentrionalis TaxID=34720 RepID=A0A195FFC0_9HYME|nr:hypothetical protein ALC56_06509 [Trachymyrmex septentrionalis]